MDKIQLELKLNELQDEIKNHYKKLYPLGKVPDKIMLKITELRNEINKLKY
jgi:hypothetical protein